MATPTPSPDPGAELIPQPAAPVVTPALPSGPACVACGGEAVVHWQRRPTDDELTQLVAAEESRRAEILELADPQLPTPVFLPLPSPQDTTRTVYACASHAISLEGASLVHLSSCTAPNEADLPGCDCTPEALPEPEPGASDEAPAASRLPEHWVTGGA